MSEVNPPLDPWREKKIAEALAEITEPDVRAVLEAKFTAREVRRQAWAERADADFNAAYERALRLGVEDPQSYAERGRAYAEASRNLNRSLAVVLGGPRRTAQRLADLEARNARLLSITAGLKPRRRTEDDREYLRIVGNADRRGQLGVPGLVPSKLKRALGDYRLPHWEKTTLALKVMSLSFETGRRGGRTINLRIGHDLSKTALGSARGPVSFIQNRVRDAFKRHFASDAPEFWFVMEYDAEGLFHLHGAYQDQAHIDFKLVDGTLRDCSGWSSSTARGMSQLSVPLKDPIWWAHYCVKSMNLTATMTNRKLVASTAELAASARGRWDLMRAELPQIKRS